MTGPPLRMRVGSLVATLVVVGLALPLASAEPGPGDFCTSTQFSLEENDMPAGVYYAYSLKPSPNYVMVMVVVEGRWVVVEAQPWQCLPA